MTRLKLVFLIIVAGLIFLTACTPNNSKASPAQTVAVQSTTEYVNPYPIPETLSQTQTASDQLSEPVTNQAYPDPEDITTLPIVSSHPENFTSGLEIPTPGTDKAIITGQLMSAGENDKPYISVIYLAPIEAASDPNQSPTINFSRKSNLMAIQDIENGRFVFSEVNPGQYAIVIWSPGGSFFVKDGNGNPLVIEGKAGETNDLGVILFE